MKRKAHRFVAEAAILGVFSTLAFSQKICVPVRRGERQLGAKVVNKKVFIT